MDNEFEYLSDRGGHGDHLAGNFLKIYCSYPKLLCFFLNLSFFLDYFHTFCNHEKGNFSCALKCIFI